MSWRPVGWRTVAVAGALILAACSPEGPGSIPLPTSSATTTTTPNVTTPIEHGTTVPPTSSVPSKYQATIRRTTGGVPHIIGDSLDDVAFGQGWASAEDHGCTLSDQIIKIYGQRSATFGPGGDGENIESDFAWKAIGITDIAATDFDTASDEVKHEFDAFTAGWNADLADVGNDGFTGWCAGADWVRPLKPVEVYAYARSIALLASSGRLTQYIAGAQPPETPAPEVEPSAFAPSAPAAPTTPTAAASDDRGTDPSTETPTDTAAIVAAINDSDLAEPVDFGSNGWAIGNERTVGGEGGLLLANPHFPWEGELRFSEVQLTVPGEVDIYGAMLLGVPGVGIGFTKGVAWTHTVSAGKRFTGYTLTLDPNDPTAYLVDGVSHPMTSTDQTIKILRADGTFDTETRTMWRSEYGPIIDFPGLGWTDTMAITFRDANIDNNEFVEQYARMPEIESLDDLIDLTEKYQGVPLFNTIATGADGRVWYADTSATPDLSDAAESAFLSQLSSNPITGAAYDQGFVLLDGSDSTFQWEVQPGARDPGLVPFDQMPMTERTDYVFNANDSYWISNVEHPLTGSYSIMNGTADTPLSLRTRQNAAVLDAANEMGLAGDDAMFDADEVRTAAFDDTGRSAVLLRAAVVDACRATPSVDVGDLVDDDGTVVLPAATVDLTEACDVLDGWDGVYDLDRAGPMVWRETMSQFDPADLTDAGPLFANAFDPTDPTHTPNTLNPDTTVVLQALARAVQTIATAGFSIGTTLGAAQFSERSDKRIPLHGGMSVDGVTNIVTWSSGNNSSTEPVPQRGEPVVAGSALRGGGYQVDYGTSFVMTVDYSEPDVKAWSILTYGQTGDRTSPLFTSQTQRFSDKDWKPVAFTDDQIAADPNLTEETVQGD